MKLTVNSSKILLKRFIYTVVFLFVFNFTYSQQPEIEKLQKELGSSTSKTSKIDILNRLATIYYLKNADSCYIYAQKAYNDANEINYKHGLADALNNIGIYYSLKTNTYLATKYYNEALQLYRNLGDTANEAQLLMNIGIELTFNNKLGEALNYMRRAFVLAQHVGYDSIMSLAISNLLTYDTSLSRDSVNKLVEKGKAVARKYNDVRMIIGMDENVAEALMRNGQIDSAIALLKKLEMPSSDIALKYELITIYNYLGQAYLKKDSVQAIAYYNKALETAKANGYTDVYLSTAKILYGLSKARKDVTASGIYAEILITAANDYQRFVQESGVNYLDYITTGQQLAVEKAKNKDRKILNMVMFVFSVVVIALLFIAYRAYKSSKRYSVSLKELNNMIYKKNQQLEQNNDFKDKLISLLAHDFRQPLVSLSSLVSLLKQHETLSRDEMERILASIESSSVSSIEIFENILQWIKSQLSGFIYKPIVLNVRFLIEEAAGLYQLDIKEKGIQLINEVDENVMIHADREMMQFIDRNLIHNAIKFSYPGSKIYISAQMTDKETIVTVKDYGAGMTNEKLNNIFSFFSGKMYNNNSMEKGAGVALFICKDFIAKMHGRIWAESEKDKGSTFYFALPFIDELKTQQY